MQSIKEEMKWIRKRNRMLRDFEERAEQRGFVKVESDAFEPYLPFHETNRRYRTDRLIKVSDLTGAMFLLKPDMTSNIIKQVLMRMDPADTLDLYYLDVVYAYDRFGKIKENRQFGVEVIGRKDVSADIAILRFLVDIFQTYAFDYVIEVGDQRFLSLLLDALDVDQKTANDVKIGLMKKNRAQVEDSLKETDRNGYRRIMDMILSESASLKNIRDTIKTCPGHDDLLESVDRLIEIERTIDNPRIVFDLSTINDYDYYNGPIHKAYIEGVNTDIARGGRYDALTKAYGDMTAALGFSLDVDALIKEVWKRENRT